MTSIKVTAFPVSGLDQEFGRDSRERIIRRLNRVNVDIILAAASVFRVSDVGLALRPLLP